ncbi:porin [Alphaproteobacteria bacterium]|nr:porin [Alphaproteobacteria bacterium]
MFKTKNFFLLIVCFIFTKVVFADMSLSGYQEFTAGSADQSTYQGRDNDHDQDQAGIKNGQYTRITADYSTTLDSGLDFSGVLTVMSRDCQGGDTDNCATVNFNFVNLSGNFGTISIGERHGAGAVMLSRLTASGPTAEPDGALFQNLYTVDAANTYGAGNEVNYATANVKAMYMSNVYSGFSFAVGYTPNMGEKGANTSGQLTSGSSWGNYNDVLAVFGKYAMEMDGVGLELVYGQQTGNAGRIGVNDYNDLEESAYSVKITYGGFEADYRKNEADNSGYVKNGQAGNDEGTSICGVYSFAPFRAGVCSVETSFTDSSNLSNSSSLMTYSADYSLGGGVTLGLMYFDHEQTANSQKRTDVDGVMSILSVGF